MGRLWGTLCEVVSIGDGGCVYNIGYVSWSSDSNVGLVPRICDVHIQGLFSLSQKVLVYGAQTVGLISAPPSHGCDALPQLPDGASHISSTTFSTHIDFSLYTYTYLPMRSKELWMRGEYT